MNAIDTIFGRGTTNLLCRRHISVDVQKYLTRLVKSKVGEKKLSSCWKSIVNAQTIQTYELAVGDLIQRFEEYPIFLQYVHNTWLDPHREKFVSYWVDQHLHYGSVTTNRVESAHSQLKRDLQSARGDFLHVINEI